MNALGFCNCVQCVIDETGANGGILQLCANEVRCNCVRENWESQLGAG